MQNFEIKKFVDLVHSADSEILHVSVSGGNSGAEVKLTAEQQTDGSYKWKLMIGAYNLIRDGNNVQGSTKDQSYRWTMRLRALHLDYHLADVRYLERDPESIESAPIKFLINGEIQTGADVTVSTEHGVTISKENTFEYGFKETLAIGATVSAKVSAPFGVAEASAELRVDASLEATQNNVISQTITYYSKDTVTVGPNASSNITAWVDWEDNGEWPFTALFNIRGTAAKADGDSEADTMTTEEVKLVLQEKGFSGQFLDPKSPVTASAKINGVMTGAFGVKKHITAT